MARARGEDCGGGGGFIFGGLAEAEGGVEAEGVKPGNEELVVDEEFGLWEAAEF